MIPRGMDGASFRVARLSRWGVLGFWRLSWAWAVGGGRNSARAMDAWFAQLSGRILRAISCGMPELCLPHNSFFFFVLIHPTIVLSPHTHFSISLGDWRSGTQSLVGGKGEGGKVINLVLCASLVPVCRFGGGPMQGLSPPGSHSLIRGCR